MVGTAVGASVVGAEVGLAAVATVVPVSMATVTIFSSAVLRMMSNNLPAMCCAGRITGGGNIRSVTSRLQAMHATIVVRGGIVCCFCRDEGVGKVPVVV